MPTVKLTKAQISALEDAANAMLAGTEGDGDAESVSFAVLGRAVDKITAKVARKNTGELVCLSRINGMGERDAMGSYVKFEWLPDDESGRVVMVTNEMVAQDLSYDINELFNPY